MKFYLATKTPLAPLDGALRTMGALQLWDKPETAAKVIRHCVDRARQGEWSVLAVNVVASGEEGKGDGE
jgi:hypothetical protein